MVPAICSICACASGDDSVAISCRDTELAAALVMVTSCLRVRSDSRDLSKPSITWSVIRVTACSTRGSFSASAICCLLSSAVNSSTDSSTAARELARAISLTSGRSRTGE